MSLNAAARGLVAIPIALALGWAAITASNIARAKSLVLEAATEMGTWAASGGQPDPATWESAKDRLEAAGRMRSADPVQRELLGLLGSLRGDRPELISEGISHLYGALELRPTSGHTWAHLAEAQYRLGEPGTSLEVALQRASLLGPAEPGVQRLVADYGLAVWSEVGPETQSAIDRMVASGMRRNPLEMLQISERRGRLDAACRHLAGTQRLAGTRHGRLCPWEITP
jgi:hypothetical protein